MNVPNDSKHEAFYTRDAEVIAGLLRLVLQDVLHDKNYVLNKHGVYITHDGLPMQNTVSVLLSKQFRNKRGIQLLLQQTLCK